MELNAEQIKKALECCQFRHIKKNCDECKYHRWIEPACRDLICQDALALINSQEQRIKELTEQAYRLECDLQLNADEKAVAKAIEQTKQATVRKMQDKVRKKIKKTEWLNGRAVYLEIDKIAKEMLEKTK